MSVPTGPYQEILRRLKAVVRRQNLFDLYRGMLASLATLVALLLAATVVERIFLPDGAARFWIFVAIVAPATAACGWFIGRPLARIAGLVRAPGALEVAELVGGRLEGVRDRLVDVMEMFPEKELLAERYSAELIDGAFESVWNDVRGLDFTGVVGTGAVKRAARIGLGAAGIALMLYFIFPGVFGASLYRIFRYDEAFASERTLTLEVTPGDIEVVRGQPLTITVRAAGLRADRITLNTRPEGRIDFETAEMTAVKNEGAVQSAADPANATIATNAPNLPPNHGAGMFMSELPGVKATTVYYASSGDTRSKSYTITVVDRPIVKSLSVSVKPPSYTRLPEKRLDENIGDISALPGSTVGIRLEASKEVAAAQMIFHDSLVAALEAKGTSVTGSFRVRTEDRYRFRLEDDGGLTNPDPIEYTVRTLRDEYPIVEIAEPGKNLDITGDMQVNLKLRIRDDYGFSALRLYYRMEHSRYEAAAKEYSRIELPMGATGHTGEADAGGIGQRDVYYAWDIGKLSLVPEDVVSYFAEVSDNDNVSGPKSSRSQTFLLRLPSLEEVLADVNNSSDRSLEDMQKMAEEMQTLKEGLEELNRDVKKQRDKIDWQQQKKAEQLAQKYETLRQKAEKTARSLEEMVKKMDDNNILSDATLQKYEELQKLMQELNSDELKEALRKLQESMQKLSPEQLREAMQKMTLTEEQFRKNLERTVELLKRIQIEQKIDELIKRTDELKNRQDALERKTSESKNQEERNTLAREQSEMSKDAESLQTQASDLGKKMEEFSKEMPLEEMNRASEALEQKNVPQQMQNSASKMQAGRTESASQSQKKSGEDLSEFSRQMQQVQNALREKQMKQVVNEMRRQIQNLLELSKNQESIKDETAGMDPNSERFRGAAQKQQETLEDLGAVANAMSELSKKTFAIGPELGREIGNAMKNMGEAMDQMELRNPGGSSGNQREAMGSMNRAAMSMQGALRGMMEAQGEMGMAGLMGRLGQMAGQQQGINAGTQQARGQSGEQSGMTAAQMAAYGRLAGEQGRLGKSLQELAQEAKNSGDFSKILGDLDRIAQEMMEVQTSLSQGDVNPETTQKQERILSRLLESQKSLRERDYEKRRTAGTGKNVERPSPAAISLETQEGKNRLREELFQVREGKYARDYEELIRKYFEQLEQGGPPKPND